MKRIYVAGKLSDTATEYIKNMHKMIKQAKKIREAGFAVYVPCLDFLEGLVDGGFNYEYYFSNSQAFLVVCDAVYVCPGWETSNGTKKEIELAKEKNIPVFFSIDALADFFEE
jgi:hypothetical protein